jgi:hypothetical protein
MATKPTGRPHGGPRAGAGRPKGAKTKTYRPHVEKILAAKPGLLPRDVMLDVMRKHYRARRYGQAVEVAALVAPYIHPKLTSSAITMRPRLSEMTDDELAAIVREAEELSLAEGKLAATKPRGNA